MRTLRFVLQARLLCCTWMGSSIRIGITGLCEDGSFFSVPWYGSLCSYKFSYSHSDESSYSQTYNSTKCNRNPNIYLITISDTEYYTISDAINTDTIGSTDCNRNINFITISDIKC